MRFLGWLLTLLLVLGCGLGVAFAYFVYAPAPDFDEDLRVQGISAPVQISFDDQHRPYVQARSMSDAIFAQGWLHARERSWQMELLRRAGNGRLAEMLGPSLLNTDLELWRVGVPQLAAALAANASSATRALVASYVAGVNAAMANQHPALEFTLLGAVPTPWVERDVYALGALMAFQSGNNMTNELLRQALVERLPDSLAELFAGSHEAVRESESNNPRVNLDRLDQLATALSSDRGYFAPPLLGSNGWVVGPQRSASGNALFAFDSHDDWSMPNLFYEVHLFFADGQQIRGWSVPGLPGVVNGFNEFMAWGFTNIGDSQDLYLEQRDSEDPTRFNGRQGWYPAAAEVIEIPVADAPAHRFTRVVTENGPLIQEEPPISLAWSAARLDGMGLDGLFALNRADSLGAFMAALDEFPAPSANATYADIEGNIVFRTVGRLPVRGAGTGVIPQSAQDPTSAWLGTQPLDQLPVVINPDTAYLAAANAAVPGEFLVSADNAPGYRQDRLNTLLESKTAVSFADMQRWQTDHYNQQAGLLLPVLLAALGDNVADALRPVVDNLEQWQQKPEMAPQLTEPLLFAHWYIELAGLVFEPALGEALMKRLSANSYLLNHALDSLLLDQPDSPWWRGQRRQLIETAFYEALVRLGEGQLRWDQEHQLLFRHEMSGAVPGLDGLLDRGPYAWGGGNTTLGRARYRYDRPFTATGGATVRVVIEMSQPMRAAAVIPGGQSGHPGSAAYDDQFERWLDGGLFDLAPVPPEVSLQLLPAP